MGIRDSEKQLSDFNAEEKDLLESISALKAITGAEARIEDLANKIEEFTAQSARLNTEIKNHGNEVAENQAALDTASAFRE